MDRKKEEQLLSKLTSEERRIINAYPSSARRDILEKLAEGYRISECDYWEVEVVMGFSYYCIERGGRMYAV